MNVKTIDKARRKGNLRKCIKTNKNILIKYICIIVKYCN